MLPSDHFVRMYNELFKMLAERGGDHLREYWLAIAELQATILGPCIEAEGFEGMYAYWDRIRIEENCEMELELTDDYFELRMLRCPSLGKNLDNDAGLCLRYCDHCAGWIAPVVRRYGYYAVYDMISRTEPRCRLRIFRDLALARADAESAVLLNDPYGDLGQAGHR